MTQLGWSRNVHEHTLVLALTLLLHGFLFLTLAQNKPGRDHVNPPHLLRMALFPLMSAPLSVSPGRSTAPASPRSSAIPSRPSAAALSDEAQTMTADSAPSPLPVIDLEAARKMALSFDHQRVRSPIERMQEENPLTRASQQLGNAIKGATRKDCLKDYAGAGLLAPFFLMADMVAEKTCKM